MSMLLGQNITRRTPILNKFFNEVESISMISPDEEFKLVQRIKEGDSNAKNELIKANLRFLIHIAKKYHKGDSELSDIINDGSIGLIKAAARFDETKGFKFISYAVWWIHQSIKENMNKTGRLVRLPINKISLVKKFNTIFTELEQTLERNPSEDEIIEKFSSKYNIVIDGDTYISLVANSVMKNYISIDYKVSDDSSSVSETLADDYMYNNPEEDENIINRLKTAIKTLPANQKMVLELYMQGLTIKEISSKLDLTRQRIDQIKEAAIINLKKKQYIKNSIELF